MDTLGDVLYPDRSRTLVSEQEWVELVRAVAAGEQLALHGLYERAHRVVFTLAVRITGNRETAEEVTLDVFHAVWRKAADYDPANGTVLGWIMNQARSRAIDRVRFESRKKRAGANGGEEGEPEAEDTLAIVALREQGEALRRALKDLPMQERAAVEAAFLSDLSHAEAAKLLNQPLGTVKTRIRTAMETLRSVIQS